MPSLIDILISSIITLSIALFTVYVRERLRQSSLRKQILSAILSEAKTNLKLISEIKYYLDLTEKNLQKKPPQFLGMMPMVLHEDKTRMAQNQGLILMIKEDLYDKILDASFWVSSYNQLVDQFGITRILISVEDGVVRKALSLMAHMSIRAKALEPILMEVQKSLETMLDP